ncbi:MAG: hypothetical protein AAF548_02720 [Actinomycetota bacterium]
MSRTELDHLGPIPGYWPSPWPVECGGPRRQKVVGLPGPDLQPGDALTSTVREIDGWPVMTILREPGEVYLLVGGGLAGDEAPPAHRPGEATRGWVERIDPVTLEPVARSADLPSGGWLWCGAIVAHENGDLYAVDGRFVHRLSPDLGTVTTVELDYDGPHNGLLVLSDGNLLTRNLGFRRTEPAHYVVLDPDLGVVEEFVLEERCMGRFSSDRTDEGEFVYFTTAGEVRRLRYGGGALSLDPGWVASYSVERGQSDGWDTTIGSGAVHLMDMGRPMNWFRPGISAQRAFRFDLGRPAEATVIDAIELPMAWNPGPPLFDPTRDILVHYDSLNGWVVAHRMDGEPVELWRREYRNFAQMIVWADTGELLVEDSGTPALMGGEADAGSVVLVDIETGEEKGRAPTGGAALGMFAGPGFDGDAYVCSLLGSITRVAPDRG